MGSVFVLEECERFVRGFGEISAYFSGIAPLCPSQLCFLLMWYLLLKASSLFVSGNMLSFFSLRSMIMWWK